MFWKKYVTVYPRLYIDFYNSLHNTFFINFFITQLKHEVVSFEEVFHWMKFLDFES